MSWHFSLVLAEVCSPHVYLGGEQSAPLKTTDTASADYNNDKTRSTWTPSQFGKIFTPSKDRRGEDELISSLADFLVKHSAQQRTENPPQMISGPMRRVISEVRPNLIFGENVSVKAIGRAAKECECDGYKAKILALSSRDVGGNYPGLRYWFLATSNLCSEFLSSVHVQARGVQELHPRIWDEAPEGWRESLEVADARQACEGREETGQMGSTMALRDRSTTEAESPGLGVVDGLASRLDRYSAIGNGQVPAVAATAFLILSESFRKGE